jgi:hypothetical protein
MIQVSVDTHNKHTNKPTSNHGSIGANIVAGWQSISSKQFTELVSQGCSFSPANFNEERKAGKWIGQQLFAVDIDSVNSPKPTEAIQIIYNLFEVQPILAYYSFSHNFELTNKYRLVIAADSVITNPNIALRVLRGLITALKADSACSDLARIFYGTTPDKIISYSENTVSTSVLEAYAKQHKPKQHISHKSTTTKELVNELTPLEALRLKNLIQEQKFHLANNSQSRYERLKLLGVKLGSLGFLSWDLASQIATSLITRDEQLTQQFVTNYDKNYLSIVQELYDWANQN